MTTFQPRRRIVGAATVLAISFCVGARPAAAQPSILTPGMELAYESNGTAGTPWRVDSVIQNIALGGKAGCTRVRFAAGGPRPGVDIRMTCATDGVLFAWDSAATTWRASRPLREGGTLEIRSATGTVSRYTTGREIDERIGERSVRVLETTVVTHDTAGRPIRRLRERYARTLGTAVWGAFEIPDPAAPDGWRVQQEFRLVAIRMPSR